MIKVVKLEYVTPLVKPSSRPISLRRQSYLPTWPSQVALEVKNLPASAGDIRDTDLIPGSGRSPGGGHGNTLQYSCLENPIDRGAWWAI